MVSTYVAITVALFFALNIGASGYTLIHTFLEPNLYIIIVIISVFIATFGSISLSKTIRKEKSSVHEQGGGI